MTEAPDVAAWARVGRALTQRVFAELRLTKAELIRRSGISAKTIDRYLAGEPIVRRDKERALCSAVGWTADSIDSILADQDPTEIARTTESRPGIEERLERIQSDLAWIREQLAGNGGESRSA